MANILRLPPSTTMTPEIALKSAMMEDLQDVLIVGYDEKGELLIRSSAMTRASATFLILKALRWAEG
jgi:hypothetical protein